MSSLRDQLPPMSGGCRPGIDACEDGKSPLVQEAKLLASVEVFAKGEECHTIAMPDGSEIALSGSQICRAGSLVSASAPPPCCGASADKRRERYSARRALLNRVASA
jgi:hypothetical protein